MSSARTRRHKGRRDSDYAPRVPAVTRDDTYVISFDSKRQYRRTAKQYETSDEEVSDSDDEQRCEAKRLEEGVSRRRRRHRDKNSDDDEEEHEEHAQCTVPSAVCLGVIFAVIIIAPLAWLAFHSYFDVHVDVL